MALSPFVFGPAKQNGSSTDDPPLSNTVANTSDAIYAGSLLTFTAGVLRLISGNPSAGTIVGVAAADNNTAPGYNMGNQPTNVSFRQNIVPYYPFDSGTLYRGHIVNNSDTYIAPVAADVGAVYGFRVRANGETVIDKNLTTTDGRFEVTRIDTEFGNNFVEGFIIDTAAMD